MLKYAAIIPLLLLLQSPARKTTLDGVFTADQSDRGAAAYEENCARCHEGEDATQLFGGRFVDRWREDPLERLFKHMSTRMPPDVDMRLPDATYVDIITFLLHENGYHPGKTELTVPALKEVLFVGPDGPKPLPANTLVRVTGCLSQEADGVWNLTRATEPVRDTEGKKSDADELKRAVEAPLGSQAIRLPSFVNISRDFKPDPFKGHKVQVKGVLGGQPGSYRVTATLLESVSSACGS